MYNSTNNNTRLNGNSAYTLAILHTLLRYVWCEKSSPLTSLSAGMYDTLSCYENNSYGCVTAAGESSEGML